MAGSVGSDDGDYGFQIAPMVDVVFVLMLFFMACAGVQVSETELSMNLPSQSGNPENVQKIPVTIDIQPNGQVVAINRTFDTPQSKELPELTAWLSETAAQYEDPVIVRPSLETPHERVMDVLNAASKAKVKNLTFS